MSTAKIYELEPLRGRQRSGPWYRVPDIVGAPQVDEHGEQFDGFALVKRDDLFLTVDDVAAFAAMALGGGNTLTVEWLQMDHLFQSGMDVPKQHREEGLAVVYLDVEVGAFYVASAKRSLVFAIGLDTVTDMAIDEAHHCSVCLHTGDEHFSFCTPPKEQTL